MPEIERSDEVSIGVKDAKKKNFSPADTLFSKINDKDTALDVALIISESNM